MELRVGICDDSQTDAAYVETFLAAWAQERALALHVERFPSAESFLFRYAEEKRFDLLLLDIEMGQLDGVTMAKEIRRDNQDVQIVFITGYSDYIAEGYEVAALHYLLKPVNGDKLRAVLDRGVDKVRRRERALTLEQGGEMVRIPLGEIRYLEVCRNYVTVHAKGDYTTKSTLSRLEVALDGRFHRLGRSMVVNLEVVRRVTKTQVVLSDGCVLPLPRGAFEGLNRAYIAHSCGGRHGFSIPTGEGEAGELPAGTAGHPLPRGGEHVPADAGLAA